MSTCRTLKWSDRTLAFEKVGFVLSLNPSLAVLTTSCKTYAQRKRRKETVIKNSNFALPPTRKASYELLSMAEII